MFNRYVNTRYFSEAAIHFQKHGCYTFAPEGHPEYVEYWNEEERRCKEGYTVGDLYITGKMYFFLNYTIMSRLKTKEEYEKDKTSKMVVSMPRFWEMSYEYWTIKYIQQHGATPEEIVKYNIPYFQSQGYEAGKHLALLKTRRGGFSYMECADAVWNYTFVRFSKSHFFTSHQDYLDKDGIFNKVDLQLNHLNAHTAFGKNRQVINQTLHKKASFIDPETLVEKGYQSELIATVLDKPDKARGKEGLKITFEEGGSFPRLLNAWAICQDQVEQGGVVKGYMTAFGTGGNQKDDGLEGLQELFDNPHVYNCIAFNNIWDEDLEGTECGLFVPTIMIREQHMDKHGNLDRNAATEEVMEERKLLDKSKDPSYKQRKIAERPLTPREALQRVSTNFFPTQELKNQLRYCESERKDLMWVNGELYEDEKKEIKFKPNSNLKAIDQYPIKPLDGSDKFASLDGCISILQAPLKQEIIYEDGSREFVTPKNLYVLTVDPYAIDKSEYSKSIGSVRVVKRDNNVFPNDNLNGNIVAKYDGRPDNLKIFWRNIFMLARYYNCKVQSEIVGGGQEGITNARHWRCTHLLRRQVKIGDTKAKNNEKPTYFTKVTTDSKETAIQALDDWLREPVGGDEEGNFVMRLRYIYDIGFLKELIKFNLDGNFDRISCMLIMMQELKDKFHHEVKDKKKIKEKSNLFFNNDEWFNK
jgi:hypothetical protein